MKVSIEEVEAGGHIMTIEVDSAQAQQIGRSIAGQVSIPGFRPGKAPLAAVMRSLSPEDLASEVDETNEVQALIQKALEESDLEPSAETRVESATWNPMILTVAVAGDESAEEVEEEDAKSDE